MYTWLGTYGYCEQDPEAEDPLEEPNCVDPSYLYLQCIRWAMGLIAGGGFPMFPDKGPFERYYSEQNNYQSNFTEQEQVLILFLKTCGLIIWALIFSQIIKAVNYADPVAVAHNVEIDTLNRFCAHNKLPAHMSRRFRTYLSEKKKTKFIDARTDVCTRLLAQPA